MHILNTNELNELVAYNFTFLDDKEKTNIRSVDKRFKGIIDSPLPYSPADYKAKKAKSEAFEKQYQYEQEREELNQRLSSNCGSGLVRQINSIKGPFSFISSFCSSLFPCFQKETAIQNKSTINISTLKQKADCLDLLLPLTKLFGGITEYKKLPTFPNNIECTPETMTAPIMRRTETKSLDLRNSVLITLFVRIKDAAQNLHCIPIYLYNVEPQLVHSQLHSREWIEIVNAPDNSSEEAFIDIDDNYFNVEGLDLQRLQTLLTEGKVMTETVGEITLH